MKLLIVVDKLLTGFDAPPATYLYIDKQMRDHGLFQAICRVNRLDGEDKEYGYVVDYKDLFGSLEQSIRDYTGEAFDGYDKADVEGLLKDRLQQGRGRLEEARESVKALCEPVEPPRDQDAYLRYFSSQESGNLAQFEENQPKRVALYKHVASFLRAYANLATEMGKAGYSRDEADAIKAEAIHYEQVVSAVKLNSGDYVDMKVYEPGMRHLIDTFIRAEDSVTLSSFNDMTLVQLILERGVEAVDALPSGIRGSKEAIASTIENNVRRLIIDESAVNPRYYERMSQLLDALIEQRRQKVLEYREYLEKIVTITKQLQQTSDRKNYPEAMTRPALQALYDNLDCNEDLALAVDEAVRTTKQDGWRGNRIKQRMVKLAVRDALGPLSGRTDEIFELVKNQHEY
jgi:type I restriction enzyme R subunit